MDTLSVPKCSSPAGHRKKPRGIHFGIDRIRMIQEIKKETGAEHRGDQRKDVRQQTIAFLLIGNSDNQIESSTRSRIELLSEPVGGSEFRLPITAHCQVIECQMNSCQFVCCVLWCCLTLHWKWRVMERS